MPYKNGKVDMKGYMMKEEAMHSKGGKANKMHEGKEGKKKKLAEKMMEKKGMGKS
jgi:hypothetical protein